MIMNTTLRNIAAGAALVLLATPTHAQSASSSKSNMGMASTKSASSSKSNKMSKSNKSSSDDMTSLEAFQARIAPGAECEFQRATTAVRGPCPAMNTLSNHGFLNRNGRAIKVFDLAQALGNNFGVDPDFLTNGPIAGIIALNITQEDADGDEALTLDALFRQEPPGQEHDSSFVRADEEVGGDRPPCLDLITLLLDATDREFLQPFEIMAYQRGRVENSCDRQVEGMERIYTGGMRGGMAVQGALLFSLAQLREETAYLELNKDNLRSIVQFETFPGNFDPASNFVVDFSDGSLSDDIRDAFRVNVEEAINNMCSASNNSEENDELLSDPFFGNN